MNTLTLSALLPLWLLDLLCDADRHIDSFDHDMLIDFDWLMLADMDNDLKTLRDSALLADCERLLDCETDL